tara:strand:+ start:2111 stop:3307 length:1197 start_codon:yes stop_codon:yes gene_type:complete
MRIRLAYNDLNISPETLESDYLEKRLLPKNTDIDIHVLDFSLTNVRRRLIGTHKAIKAKHGLEYVAESDGNYAHILTAGSTGSAFNTFAEEYFQDIQVVQWLINQKVKNLIKIGKKVNGKGPSISIQAPNLWFEFGQLEGFWMDLFTLDGNSRASKDYKKIIQQYRESPNFKRLYELVRKKPLAYNRNFDVTNACEYSKNENPYENVQEIIDAVNVYDHCFVPWGSAELFEAFRKIRKNSKAGIIDFLRGRSPAKLLAVTVPGNPCSTNPDGESDADKLVMYRLNKQNEITRRRMDSKSLFFTAPRQESNTMKGILDSVVRYEDPAEFDMRTGNSSCTAFVPFRLAEPYQGGLVIPAYTFGGISRTKIIDQDYIIKPGESVCVVNTAEQVGRHEKEFI